jgi:hypothetical protein
MESYELVVEKTTDGMKVAENTNLSDFEIVGILEHLKGERLLKIKKQLDQYEQEREH